MPDPGLIWPARAGAASDKLSKATATSECCVGPDQPLVQSPAALPSKGPASAESWQPTRTPPDHMAGSAGPAQVPSARPHNPDTRGKDVALGRGEFRRRRDEVERLIRARLLPRPTAREYDRC